MRLIMMIRPIEMLGYLALMTVLICYFFYCVIDFIVDIFKKLLKEQK
jgi:hypothetical protein